MVREGGEWKTRRRWEVALETAAKGLKAAGAELATHRQQLARPSKSSIYCGKLTRALGSANIDHRLRQADFRDQAGDPAAPGLGGLAIAGHRRARRVADRRLATCAVKRRCSRTACARPRKRGAKVAFLNPTRFDYLFPVAAYLEYAAGQAARATSRPSTRPAWMAPPRRNISRRWSSGAHENVASSCRRRRAQGGTEARDLAGCARAAPSRVCGSAGSWPRAWPPTTGATLATLAEGGNAAGAYLAGAVPHREPGGIKSSIAPGKNARDMLATSAEGLPVVRRHRALGRWRSARDALKALRRRELRRRRHAVRRRHAQVESRTCCCPSPRSSRPRART